MYILFCRQYILGQLWHRILRLFNLLLNWRLTPWEGNKMQHCFGDQEPETSSLTKLVNFRISFIQRRPPMFNRWSQTLTSNMFMTTKIELYSESRHQFIWTWNQLIALLPYSRRASWVPGFLPTPIPCKPEARMDLSTLKQFVPQNQQMYGGENTWNNAVGSGGTLGSIGCSRAKRGVPSF